MFPVKTWLALIRQSFAGWRLRVRQAFKGVFIDSKMRYVGGGELRAGPGVVIHRGATISIKAGARLVLGRDTRIGADAFIVAHQEVVLGDNVLVAARCMISDIGHAFVDTSRPVMQQGATQPKPINIGAGSWLGVNVAVLPGASLGENCVVGANSVVNKSFPARSVIAGTPAKLVRILDDQRSTDIAEIVE